jgi:PhnB protein
MASTTSITPRLVVDDAAAAIDFYVAALCGTELMRYAEPSGKIVQAEVLIGDSRISLTEHDGNCNLSPRALGGSPLLLTISVDDAYAVGRAMVAHGATVIIEIDDRYYGRREGRFQDPAGHLWIVSQHLEDLSPDQITDRSLNG